MSKESGTLEVPALVIEPGIGVSSIVAAGFYGDDHFFVTFKPAGADLAPEPYSELTVWTRAADVRSKLAEAELRGVKLVMELIYDARLRPVWEEE